MLGYYTMASRINEYGLWDERTALEDRDEVLSIFPIDSGAPESLAHDARKTTGRRRPHRHDDDGPRHSCKRRGRVSVPFFSTS